MQPSPGVYVGGLLDPELSERHFNFVVEDKIKYE